MLSRGTCRSHRLVAGVVPEIHATGDVIRPVLRDLNRGRAIRSTTSAARRSAIAAPSAPKGTPGSRAEYRRLCRLPGQQTAPSDAKHRGQRVSAPSGVRADSSVVEDGELPCCVGVEPVGDAVGMLPVVEADRRVSAIAPWLRLRPAAPAQGCNRRRRRGLTEEVRHECAARQQVGPFSRTRMPPFGSPGTSRAISASLVIRS